MNRDIHRASSRRPHPRITCLKVRHHGRSHRGRQVRNPRIIPNENPRTAQPAREFIEVGDKDRLLQLLLRPPQPIDRHFLLQAPGRRMKRLHRRSLRLRTGKGVYSRKRPRHGRAGNSREASRRHPQSTRLLRVKIRRMARPIRKRAQESERQPQRPHKPPKLGPILSVPGHDVIKPTQTFHNVIRMRNAQPVHPGRPDRTHPVRKPHERNVLLRAPDFGLPILRRKSIKCRQAQDEIANCAWPDQQPLLHKC